MFLGIGAVTRARAPWALAGLGGFLPLPLRFQVLVARGFNLGITFAVFLARRADPRRLAGHGLFVILFIRLFPALHQVVFVGGAGRLPTRSALRILIQAGRGSGWGGR